MNGLSFGVYTVKFSPWIGMDTGRYLETNILTAYTIACSEWEAVLRVRFVKGLIEVSDVRKSFDLIGVPEYKPFCITPSNMIEETEEISRKIEV
jgi:hypothetical protein